jgi:hypothetical protein
MKTLLALFLSGVISPLQAQNNLLTGAWKRDQAGTTTILIYTQGFFAVSTFHQTKFMGTFGGSYEVKDDLIIEKIEFDTEAPDRIGTVLQAEFKITQAGNLRINKSPTHEFTRLDNAQPGKLAGAWLITGRISNGEMCKITPGARRTMKILSGTRFQWIAYNVETKEFFGTGGGTYTTVDGKYTENIDFFSRDQTRVGISLSFDFALTPEGDWRHSGKSSKGDPIDEVWSKREKLGM